MNSLKLFNELFQAKNENDIKAILKKNFIWNDDRFWRPYGGNKNNEGVIDNQQDNSIAALMEKPINSLDAVLIKECRLRGIDPKGEKAPKTMQQAVKEFFEVKNGNFFEEDQAKRRELAQNVRIIAEGEKKEPNIIIADFGEGQTPEEFPGTFLSLNIGESKKNKIPFVQGRYNMGGSGVLGYCGKYHFQLILSRKHPEFSNGNNLWGFTLVREHPANSEDEQTWAEYLVNSDDNNVFSFARENLEILPNKESMSYGTYIKLYNYQLPTGRLSSYVNLHLWREINRFLYSPPLPILIQESRSNERPKIMLGNRTRIHDNKMESNERRKVEDSEDYSNVKIGIFENRDIEIIAFKDGTHTGKGSSNEFTKKEEAIFFTVNGQTHHALKRSFFSRAKLDFLKDELMVHIDCSSVPYKRKKLIFMPSRDRVRKSKELKDIEKDLLEILRNDTWLRKLNHTREQKSIVHSAKDQKFANKVFSKLLKTNPAISALLNLGKQVKTGMDKTKKHRKKSENKQNHIKSPVLFQGKKFPTFFEIYKWNSEKGLYHKEIPQNSCVSIKFQTDVQNDYLNEIRGDEKGQFKCNVPDVLKGNVLRNGILTAKIEVPTNKQAGDTFTVRFELTHPCADSFFQEIQFIVLNPQNTENKNGQTKDTIKKNAPRLISVHAKNQEELERNEYKIWEEMNDFKWDENTISQVKEGENMDVYINMDALHLHNFLKYQGINSKKKRESVIRNYQIAVLLYSVVLKSKSKKITEENDNLDEEKIFQIMMQGISSIILDLIIDNQKLLSFEDEL